MGAIAVAGLFAVEAALAVITAYVVALTVAAFLPRRRREVPDGAPRSFAVLIPAHDEERLLGRLLASLAELDYPAALYDVYVVADNCSDGTAGLARERGARVYERRDTSRIGKGHALQWLLERVRARGRGYDAFVILDADSAVSPNFLRVMNERLLAGSLVVQAYYTVANPTDSWSAALRAVALALVHYLRPRGKGLFGGSAGLKGNGMAFASRVMERFGWDNFTLAEDVEFHLKLVSAGITVDFAPEAVVKGEMPASLRGARSQNLRWERGRLEMARRYVPRLLWSGLLARDPARVDAALEQLVPPFSVPVALSALGLAGALLLDSGAAAAIAVALLLGQLLYVLGGLALVRAPARVYLSLLLAPAYVAWKLWLYLVALRPGDDGKWVRTSRS